MIVPVPLLNNGVTYTCGVMANNAVGSGPQSIAINSITPGASAGLVPIALSITGADSVNQGEKASYTARLSYNDGSMQTVMANWSLSGSAASIDVNGGLTAHAITGNQQVTVYASYAAGLTLSASQTVLIAGVTPAIATLDPGWNLLGNSVNAPLNVASTFNDANIYSVWKWEPTGTNNAITYPAWAFYTPALTDGGAAYAAAKGYDLLTTINGGEGFWVNAKVSSTVAMPPGTAISSLLFAQTYPPYQLPSGWSLIAVGDNPTPGLLANILSPTPPLSPSLVSTSFTSLWAWDSASLRWYFYAPGLANAGTLRGYIASKGYQDFTQINKTLDPVMGFWINHP